MYKIYKLTPIILSAFMPFISSCSDDDDNQGGGGNDYRKDAIVESILVNGRTYYQFSYDEQGNISAIYKNGSTYQLSLNGNQLSINNGYSDAVCSLSGGRISNIDYIEYEYNNTLKYAGNHLSKGAFYSLTWNGNQIVKTIENDGDYYEEKSYEYSDINNNANIDFNIIVSQRMDALADDDFGWIVSAIGLTGTRTDKLISKETCYENEVGYGSDTDIYSYDYDIDAQQRVIKITKTRNGNIDDTYEIIYSEPESI